MNDLLKQLGRYYGADPTAVDFDDAAFAYAIALCATKCLLGDDDPPTLNFFSP